MEIAPPPQPPQPAIGALTAWPPRTACGYPEGFRPTAEAAQAADHGAITTTATLTAVRQEEA